MKKNQAVPEGLKALGDRKTAIVPTEQRLLIESGQNTAAKKDDDDDDDDDNATATTAACDKEVEFKHIPSALRVGRSRSSVAQAHSIHEEHEKHERILAELQMRRQKRCTLRTQQRVLARSMLRSSRALSKLDVFASLPEIAIEEIIEEMAWFKHKKGDVVVCQGDLADKFFVLTKGTATVHVVCDESAAEGGGKEVGR